MIRILIFSILLLATSQSAIAQLPQRIEGIDINQADNAYYVKGNQINNYNLDLDVRDLSIFFNLLFEKQNVNDTLTDFLKQMFEDVTQNANNIVELTSQLQLGIDTLLVKDSLQQIEIERLKISYKKLSNEIETLDGYSTVAKVDNEFVIDFKMLKGNKELLFNSDFHEGLAKIYNGYNSWGFIDKQGEMIIDFQYEDAGYFSNELAPVKKNGVWYYINKENEIGYKGGEKGNKYKKAFPFYEEYALVQIGGLEYDIINIDKTNRIWYEGSMFKNVELLWTNGEFHLFKDPKREYFYLEDKKGKEILKAKYISFPSEGIISYSKTIKSNSIVIYDCRKKESLILNQNYVSASPFINGLSIVLAEDGKSSIIDIKNAAKLPFRKQKITRITSDKYEIKFGLNKKVIYQATGHGEIKCINGGCYDYLKE